MAFPFQQNIAVSKSDSQQLSIMGFVLLDTPAALLLAFGREDPTAQPPNHLERHVALLHKYVPAPSAPKRKAGPS
jgi:hypothetical protein